MSKKHQPKREDPDLYKNIKLAIQAGQPENMMATSTSEDFTFPTLTAGIDSPPLWHLSPATSPSRPATKSSNNNNGQNLEENKIGSHNFDDEEEEKMDMLWEDFNDESSIRRQSEERLLEPTEMVEMGCVQALKLSKRESALFSKRPGLVEIFKVLKKIFLLNNNYSHHHHRPAKSRRATSEHRLNSSF